MHETHGHRTTSHVHGWRHEENNVIHPETTGTLSFMLYCHAKHSTQKKYNLLTIMTVLCQTPTHWRGMYMGPTVTQ